VWIGWVDVSSTDCSSRYKSLQNVLISLPHEHYAFQAGAQSTIVATTSSHGLIREGQGVAILLRIPSSGRENLEEFEEDHGSCDDILNTQLARLIIQDVAVSDGVTPDQALADAGHREGGREQLQEV